MNDTEQDPIANNSGEELSSKESRIGPPNESQKGYNYTILQYRNMCNMIISTIVLFNLAWIRLYGTFRNASLPFVILHLIFDLPFATTELQVHHLLGIFMGYIKYIYNVYSNPDSDWHITNVIYKTEISSIFYVLRYWLKEDNAITRRLSPNQQFILQKANDIAFYLSFFKFRIYDYTNEIILNVEGFRSIEMYTNGLFIHRFAIYSGLVGLYLLNLQWFTIMTKILYKSSIHVFYSGKNTIIANEVFTKFAYFMHIPLVAYVYSHSPNESYLFDMIGIAFLSLVSYEFHDSVITTYKKHNTIVYTSYDIISYYFKDQVGVHLRPFLGAFSALYNSPDYKFIYIPAIFHIFGCSSMLMYLHELKRKSIDVYFDPRNEECKTLIKIQTLTTIVPITFDAIIIASQTTNTEAAIKLVIASYVCVLLSTITPFYKLNHSILHICLIFSSYYISKCNMR